MTPLALGMMIQSGVAVLGLIVCWVVWWFAQDAMEPIPKGIIGGMKFFAIFAAASLVLMGWMIALRY